MRDEHADWVLFYLDSIRFAVGALVFAVLSVTSVSVGIDIGGLLLAVCSFALLVHAFSPETYS